MKKQFIYLLLLWVTFNGFSQKLSVSTQNTVDTKYQQIERITNFSPSYFMQSPQRLLEYWGDEVLDIKLYSEKERSFQERINETLAKKFVLAHAESHDEDFPNDNYQLPLEQRLIDNEPITPYTWKWVSFEIRQESGRTESVKLCRPNWFLKKLGATAIGRTVYLSIPETGIDGYAIVTKISPCQLDTRLLSPNSKSEYVYRPITGQFQHQQAEVWDFEFSDGSTIGATSNHPFFSLERGAYVAVGELKLGETVKNAREKTLKLTSKTLRSQTETVYNLEVYRDHTYLVGKDGVLVHNIYYFFDVARQFASGLTNVGDLVVWSGQPYTVYWAKVGSKIQFGDRSLLASILGNVGNIEAHHIIPWKKGGNHPLVQLAANAGFHLNHIYNGIGLPKFSRLTGDGLHGNHPAYDKYIEYRLNRFMELNPHATALDASEFLQDTLIGEMKTLILKAQTWNSGSLNDYFKDVINPSLGL